MPCYYCTRKFSGGDQWDPRSPACDHIIPRFRGGKDISINFVTACRQCNTRKSSLNVASFLSENPYFVMWSDEHKNDLINRLIEMGDRCEADMLRRMFDNPVEYLFNEDIRVRAVLCVLAREKQLKPKMREALFPNTA
jgi:hypothetical protein